MSGDLYVSFGADTGELEAAFAKASAEVRGLARELSAMANEARKTGADADSELGQKLNATAESLALAKGHVRDLKDEMKGFGAEAREAGEGGGALSRIGEAFESALSPLSSLRAGFSEMAELVAAAFAVEKVKEFVESMATLGLETKKASEVIGASTEDVGALSLVAKASGSSLDQLEMQFARFAKNMAEETKGAKRALDTLGLSFDDLRGKAPVEQIEMLADAFARLPAGVERTAAAQEIFGRAGLQMLPMLAQGREAIEDWRRAAEATGTALSEGMVESMEETHRAATTLGAALEGVAVALYGGFRPAIDGAIAILTQMAESFSASVREAGVLNSAVWLLNAAFGGLEIVISELIAIFRDLWDAGEAVAEALTASFRNMGTVLADEWAAIKQGLTGGGFDFSKARADSEAFRDQLSGIWRQFHDEEAKINSDLDGQIKAITGQQDRHTGAIAKTSEAALELKQRFDEVLDSIKGAGGGLDDLQKKMETLTQVLGGIPGAGGSPGAGPGLASLPVTGSATDLIKHFEGFQATAKWDVNAQRLGYGSDTMTDASGGVRKVQEGDTTTREDAERDLARRVGEFQAKAAEEVGAAWATLSEKARASLTSVAYNYGHLPSDIAAAAKTGDESKIAGSIRGHERDNGGINAGRRAQEAANIEGVELTPEKAKQAEDARDALHDKILKQKQEEEGGSPIDKAELDNLQARAKGFQDDVAEKQRLIAATREQLGLVDSQAEKEKLNKKLLEEEAGLTKAQNSSKEADLALKIGAARGKGDNAGEHQAAVELANFKMSLYGKDTAEYKRAVAEKEAADRRFNSESNRAAREATDEEIKAVRTSAGDRRKALDDDLSHKRISSSQWLAASQAVNQQEASDIRALYEKELQLANQTVEQKVAIKNREADALRQINQREAEDARKSADATASSYEGAVGGILSSFTSAFKGMISGHESFRQAMQKAMMSLADKAVDMVEKMVVKWIAGELAKTTASTAGDAARTASSAAASAAGSTMAAASMLKSIFGSAGQAFAGVFGFMAPMMGPAAAGPAAAAEATVISVGSGLVAAADIGMWKVPGDQLAMIHHNELIMPAAQAGAFRDMLTGAASGNAGGGKSVHVNPQMHVHVGAMDASGFGGFLRNNQRELMKAMHGAVRQGAHLGLRGAR